ncbi:PP2C family serine/threonine-protein phosphatase [Sporobolomyces salmoneus]|uniref:PP2C family serine/threonine-protein phosphatase n=1 Tax=Sporobolomyces salmoneus TaxID=183962 RepID=UPI00317DE750
MNPRSSSSASTSSSSSSAGGNALVVPVTLASSSETFGVLNQHPVPSSSSSSSPGGGFRVGVSVDRNKKCRRTMEDAHSFIYDFGGVRDQGFWAVWDGHAGKHAAEWCGMEFHKYLLANLNQSSPSTSVPSILNKTFQQVDSHLSHLATSRNLHSGCTAVVAFLRLEDAQGNAVGGKKGTAGLGEGIVFEKEGEEEGGGVKVEGPAQVVEGVSRGGKAVRLSYDHKGTDLSEVKRITDAGGFVLNNRVNGVLAVTRALGDSSMKEFVVGKPYTTETELGEKDDWLIVACDGLWDVCSDEEAVEICRKSLNAQDASQRLLDHALANFSTDNLSVLVVDLKPSMRRESSNESNDADKDGEGDETRTEEES